LEKSKKIDAWRAASRPPNQVPFTPSGGDVFKRNRVKLLRGACTADEQYGSKAEVGSAHHGRFEAIDHVADGECCHNPRRWACRGALSRSKKK